MQVVFRKSFQKDFAKCSAKVQAQIEERVALFIEDRFHPLLHTHTLRGEFRGCHSINVNADIRAIFYIEGDTMHLIRVGSHATLYG